MAKPSAFDKAVLERQSESDTLDYLDAELTKNAITPLDEVQVAHLLVMVNAVQSAVIEVHKKIQLCAPADMSPHQTEYQRLLSKSLVLLSGFTGIKMKFPGPGTASGGTAHVGTASTTDIRLPRLELPTFDGDLQHWVSFRDMFITAVHDNTSLSKSQKLTYLKSQLKGEAAGQISSMMICEANYDIAWSQLACRYQNDRELFLAIMRRFHNQPQVTPNSPNAIRQLVDVSRECIRSLDVLKIPTDKWDACLLFVILTKMDSSSKELWEQTLTDSAIPPLQKLFDFLEQRARALAASTSIPEPQQKPNKPNTRQQAKQAMTHHTKSSNCQVCNGQWHPLYKCSSFLSLTVPERVEALKKGKACFNCLQTGHSSTQCQSTRVCRTCSNKHHTLIHRQKQETDEKKGTPAITNLTTQSKEDKCSTTFSTIGESETLFATALVGAFDQQGQPHKCRAMVDNCSNRHYITEEKFNELRLSQKRTHLPIQGLGEEFVGAAKGFAWIKICPHFNSSQFMMVKFLIVKKISCKLPLSPFPHKSFPHLQNIELADPHYYLPATIDMLLGSEVFYAIIGNQKKMGPAHAPVALISTFGWLVGGGSEDIAAAPCLKSSTFNTFIKVNNEDDNLDFLLRRLWEIDSSPSSKVLSREEEECEANFKSNVQRDQSGRIVVRLPFKDPKPELGSSLQMATKRLHHLEKRLANQASNHKQEYIDFMREYEALGHMVEVDPPSSASINNYYYIPHHFVLKDSTTTKLRVVFDASAKTSNGVSLNQALMVGPTIQDNLVDILMRFRLHKIGFTADVAKMYRQVLVDRRDTSYQRILWREDQSESIKHYELLTVTYGTGPAPFLSTRSLHELANSSQAKYPEASAIIKRDFYVDDVLSGASSEEEVISLQKQLIDVLKTGGFDLRKWTSNSQAVMNSIPEELRGSPSLQLLDLDSTVKALGVYWNPANDNFIFKITDTFCKSQSSKLTKRELLSQIAKLFDPMGWLAPVVICAKILMQQVWKEKVNWDDLVSIDIQQQWEHFKGSLVKLEELDIPRYYMAGSNLTSPYHIQDATNLCLIGFCDASEAAFAAIVYLAAYQGSNFSISIITSKTRVAPTKKVSLPRLELSSALLLAELMSSVKLALKLQLHSVSAFSDSTVALGWIRGHPSKWKTFVANRVTKIQDCIPIEHWGHVSGIENPADCASRGIDPSSLITHPLWWTGPTWLSHGIPSPSIPTIINDVTDAEKREPSCNATSVKKEFTLLHKFSNFHKLLRVTAYCIRFVTIIRKKLNSITDTSEQQNQAEEVTRVGPRRNRGCGLDNVSAGNASRSHLVSPLSPEEINDAMTRLVNYVQSQHFKREKALLMEGKGLQYNSSLLSLSPFVDENKVLRVGGRLKNADLNVDKKTPMLLPRHDQFTRLLIRATHEDNFHAGPQLVQSTIYQRYWIIRGRDAIRHEIKKCVRCTRLAAQVQNQLMGDLPKSRITPARPFNKCGVDYAGPFLLKPNAPRSKVTIKGYLAIFVCFVTRAIHLEVASDLSTDAFQAALRRFVSRRGRPTDIYSDCGTNFKGAARELKEWLALTYSENFNNNVSKECAELGIQWHFIPPGAPHFGGLWEAGVRSVKFHLKRILGPQLLTYEQLSTVVIQIEACLNSRPLTAASSDPNDLTVLTPGHFLIGAPLKAIPEPDLTQTKMGQLDRWQLLQQINQHFWNRWSSEFLTRLQQRPKWAAAKSEIKIGDLVLIKDERMPPQQWKLGRVILLHPGIDKIARVATLKTADGELKRPFVKLCLLPIDNSTD